jgi:hypothetical protein
MMKTNHSKSKIYLNKEILNPKFQTNKEKRFMNLIWRTRLILSSNVQVYSETKLKIKNQAHPKNQLPVQTESLSCLQLPTTENH